MMQARMKHPVMVVPDALKVLHALGDADPRTSLPEKLLRTRASARQPDQRLQRLRRHACEARARRPARPTSACSRSRPGATRPISPTPNARRSALTEALTRLSDRADPVPDAIWDEAAKHYDETELADLILAIASINVWNRLNVAVRQPVGVWKG